jgi:hypothetical protein
VTVQTARKRGAAFFDELRDTWRRAVAAVGVETRRYRAAGTALELRFAGDALIGPLTRALAHLAPARPEDDALVVYAWESTTTGTALPRAPWNADDFREYGKIRGFFDERFQSVFQWGSHSLVVLDVERNEAVYCVAAAEQIPYFEMAAPLRLVLHGWLRTKGVELVHAAAVGADAGCVLLVGKAGSGKSWATLAAATSGLQILADDYCLAAPGTPARISSIYNAAKTHADALEFLPFLGGMVSNPTRPDDDKAVYFLHEHVPDRLMLEAELRAILIPRRAEAATTALCPAPRAAALAALAPSTILQLPAAGAATLERLTELVRGVPTHFLDVGSDPGAIGPTISTLLERRTGR